MEFSENQTFVSEFNSDDRIIKIKPLEYLPFRVTVPRVYASNHELNHDYVTTMKIDGIQTIDELLTLATDKIDSHEIPYSRAYISETMNTKHLSTVNLLDGHTQPRKENRVDPMETRLKQFEKHWLRMRKTNMIHQHQQTQAEKKDDKNDVTDDSWKRELTLMKLNIRQCRSICYAPFFVKPGLYTLRYALVDDKTKTKEKANSNTTKLPHDDDPNAIRSYYSANFMEVTTPTTILSSAYFLHESTRFSSIYSFLSIPLFTKKDFFLNDALHEQYRKFLHGMYWLVFQTTLRERDVSFQELIIFMKYVINMFLKTFSMPHCSNKMVVCHTMNCYPSALIK
jgi:hypothetical protein